jgi:hypothetical protein
MIFSDEDLQIVNELLVPSMGTETLAPLLHFLVRFVRAQNVLEGGVGYTTPFLAKALAMNKLSFTTELEALHAKTSRYLDEIKSGVVHESRSSKEESPEIPIGLSALYKRKSSFLAQKRFEWLFETPSWARPGYYLNAYEPKLFCMDDLRNSESSAPMVLNVIERIGLSGYVSFHDRDFWASPPQSIFPDQLAFDLIWIDLPIGIRGMIELIQGDFWNCLRGDGGLLIIHDMMTTRGGQFLVDELKRQQKNTRFADFELVGFLEPQRLMQGDVVIIRKTSGQFTTPVDDVIHPSDKNLLEEEAEALMNKLRM